ncbi:hypothetical protein PV10_08589 [Exophiala mesophila]|uniref:MARVEL domain-containing protein n=1 Tax=Exophiala mesophila TaxID=212818 RepID=A0A0D1WJA1_EXOME|nr:uncharacterized protein PV10_08589 [Exophiala mesophila]KIV88965.1 hypothetical protein PV10_08589 [Exophiala mesophila]
MSSPLNEPTPNAPPLGVVPMPRWSNWVGCARVVIAVLVLAFTAAATAICGGYTGFGFALFTSSATLLIFVYYYVCLSYKPRLYNRWVILGLEIFGVVFWIVAFALLADWTAFYNANNWWLNYYDDNYDYSWEYPYTNDKSRHSGRLGGKYRAAIGLAGTAAGLGAVEFVLFAVTLVIFGLSLHKQRQEARTASTAPAATTEPTTSTVETKDVEVGQE